MQDTATTKDGAVQSYMQFVPGEMFAEVMDANILDAEIVCYRFAESWAGWQWLLPRSIATLTVLV